MNSRTLSGLLLLFGPVIMLLFYGALGPDGADAVTAKYAYGVGTLGFLMMVLGLSLVKDEMAGGEGFVYAQVGILAMVIAAGAGIVEMALEIVSAEAASPVHTALFAGAAQSVGGLSTALFMLGLAVVGIAFLVQKNVNQILSGLLAIGSIAGAVAAATVYDDDDVMLPILIGIPVLIAVLGIIRLRSKA